MTTKTIAAAISKHPFGGGLSTEHLKALAEYAMQTRFAKGDLVLTKGDWANRFYLIQKGLVAVESPAREGEWLTLQKIGPGDVLGWSWLFEPYRWHFRARALETTTAIFFYGTRLRTYCEENTALGFELVKRMAQVAISRLESTQRQLINGLRFCS